jgi:FkbM family methyltransferase
MQFTVPADCQIPGLAAIYERCFRDQFLGIFVEIGAFDGRVVSNTCGLADAGWIGYYVEAHPDFARVCAKNHAKNHSVQVFQTAIGDHVGTADFYVVGECSSTVWNQTTIDWGGRQDRKITVPMTTLDLQLERMGLWPACATPSFDLLVIDVEGAELAVLAGFTIEKWRPKMVIIETHEKDGNAERNAKAAPITAYFAGHSYKKIYTDHINSIFVTADCAWS